MRNERIQRRQVRRETNPAARPAARGDFHRDDRNATASHINMQAMSTTSRRHALHPRGSQRDTKCTLVVIGQRACAEEHNECGKQCNLATSRASGIPVKGATMQRKPRGRDGVSKKEARARLRAPIRTRGKKQETTSNDSDEAKLTLRGSGAFSATKEITALDITIYQRKRYAACHRRVGVFSRHQSAGDG
jgi:hypothetical protein